jgi:hypothetical protein
MIARWRHILTRHTTRQSINLSRSFRHNQSMNTLQSSHTATEERFDASPFSGKEKTVETIISAGSSFAPPSPHGSTEEPAGLIQHMAKMGRRGSAHLHKDEEKNAPNPSMVVTVKKEVYIREEQVDPPV